MGYPTGQWPLADTVYMTVKSGAWHFLSLPRCGHYPWFERYGRGPVLDFITEWLRSHSASQAT
jgi:hypothetical protein